MLLGSPRAVRVTADTQRRWPIFWVLAATAALTILDVSKVGVALPVMQRSLGAPDVTLQLMVVGYTVAYALLLLPSGRLGDLLSRKKVFLAGSLLFILASLLCAVAPDPAWLVAGRVVQGTGAGILMPQVLGLIQRLFPSGERAKPLALLGGTIAVTSTVGPVIAGVVIEATGSDDGWRWLFWINVGVGVVILPLAWHFVREPGSTGTRGFDWIGAALLVPAIVLTVLPLSTLSGPTPPSGLMLGSVAVGLISAGAFVWHERRLSRANGEPLVDPMLYSFRHFPAGVLIAGLMHATGTASTLVITLFFQQGAGQTPLQTAGWILPSAVAMVAGSGLAGRLPDRLGYRLITTGAALNTGFLLAIAVAIGSIAVDSIPVVLAALLLVNSFGSSLVQAPNQARTLLLVPAYRSSIAGSVIQVSQRIGSALGMALALIVYYALRERPVPLMGQPALGAAVAVTMCAGFTLLALIVALVDRDRRIAP